MKQGNLREKGHKMSARDLFTRRKPQLTRAQVNFAEQLSSKKKNLWISTVWIFNFLKASKMDYKNVFIFNYLRN